MIELPPFHRTFEMFHWRLDADRAVAECKEALIGVRDGMVDPFPAGWESLLLACEIVADGRGGEPGLAISALRAVEPDLIRFERAEGLDIEASARLRLEYTTARAAAYHRAGESYLAFRWCLNALLLAEDRAGGRERLVERMAERRCSGLVELTVAFMSIFAASLRRAGLMPDAYRRWVGWGRDLVRAYVLWSDELVKYPRSAALAVQWMYLLIAEGDPRDAELIEALYALDVEIRPNTPRAEATNALRDFEIARFRGDHARAARQRDVAIAKLSSAALDRHVAFVKRFRYLEAKPA